MYTTPSKSSATLGTKICGFPLKKKKKLYMKGFEILK